jgi:hypothetical protein
MHEVAERDGRQRGGGMSVSLPGRGHLGQNHVVLLLGEELTTRAACSMPIASTANPWGVCQSTPPARRSGTGG